MMKPLRLKNRESPDFSRGECQTNIERLEFIDENMKKALMEANGLRNRLVHRYNQTDDLIAFVSIKELLPKIDEFVDVIERWMWEKLREK